MILPIIFLSASLILILLSCYIFVNAIECLGKACNLHQGIVGSILAAIGTALPETIIPIIAIFFAGGGNAHEVGIGAIAGAPFMLATLGFFVTGAAVIFYSKAGKRSPVMKIDCNVISKDLTFFLLIYGTAVAASFVHEIIWLKISIAVMLVLSYIIYFRLVVSSESDMLENVDRLYMNRFLKIPENMISISIQIVISLFVIIEGAELFIKYVQELSNAIGIAPLILSIIITPVATELPEKLNSIIWVGRSKETLAVGNITGAMVFQSCFPVAFGMICTPWNLHGITMVSAALALGSAAINLFWIKKYRALNPYILMSGCIFYAAFILAIFTCCK
jgi:cation:H+ antiporter